MPGIFKRLRRDDVSITPYEAHKYYLVYVSDYTGSYVEPNYAQWLVQNQSYTSSAFLTQSFMPLNVYAYDAEHDDSDFIGDEIGEYGAMITPSAHSKTTNGFYKRSMHDSLQGMYYTNPDNPMWTLCNNGYEKEFRTLNRKAQILSVPQRMMGSGIHKGTVKIQHGPIATRKTFYDDGYGNLYNSYISQSVNDQNAVVSFYSQSIISLNFNDLYNVKQRGDGKEAIGGHTMIQLATDAHGADYNSSFRRPKHRIRFFDKSPYENQIETFKVTPNTSSAVEGTYVEFDGITPSTQIERESAETHSLIRIRHNDQLDLRSDDDFSIFMRFSASVHQPSSKSINVNGPYNFIAAKFDDVYRGGYPFCIKYSNDNANSNTGSGTYPKGTNPYSGIPGGIQAMVSDGVLISVINSTGSVNDGNFHNLVFQKTGSHFQLYIDGKPQLTGSAGTSTPLWVPNSGSIHNNEDVVIGARSTWAGAYSRRSQGLYHTSKRPKLEYFRNFKGSVSAFQMFNKSLIEEEIQFAESSSGNMTNIVGNVFYQHGIITLTDTNPIYDNTFSECTLSFQNTHTIIEHEYSCHLKEREYNFTMNPTIMESSKYGTIKHFVTGSEWSPYITTIGLYDERARLLAVGKLSRPLKKSEDYDTTINIQFDT